MNQPDDVAALNKDLKFQQRAFVPNHPKAQQHKLPWVDALRGLAIFGVLIYHTSQKVEHFPALLSNLAFQGAMGVQLFYMVSAFTLFLSLDSRKKTENKPLINFFIRRFFRIAPLFYCAITFYLVKNGLGPSYWVEDGKSITITNLIAHITFTNGWNPYWINSLVPVGWSIAIEMPFYLLVPYLFKKIKTIDRAIWLAFGSLLISKLINVVLFRHSLIPDRDLWGLFLGYSLPSQLPFFSLGIVLYFLVRNADRAEEPSDSYSQRSQFQRKIILLFFVSFLLAVFSHFSRIQLGIFGFLEGIALVGLAVFLSRHSSFLLVNSFWCYLGKISYSAYLTHLEVLPIAKNLLQKTLALLNLHLPPTVDFILLLAALVAGTLAISSITYRFIELPGLHLGRTLISRLESSAS